ncbi:MAG: tRNA (adenosine(37)-N6)-threonylcarbamoyltransferase complex dimerization subunit type 1 TsaB [Betaproteobacteria bacterium]|nr:MAG: tRNA (adenosine(37)-N6)-threonylcarbamoyltransferase complex dimerization subunit type 1 TsaB [Betaproteobacteria bacterium]
MILAALETSADWCSVAISIDGEIAALEQRAGQRQAELALPMLGQLLAQAGIAAGRLDAVAFGAGPGSFTGLRIACGLAQGIAFALELPVIGVSTLEALAEESGAARVVACIDARMREVYYACLERDGALWREVLAARCVAPQSVPVPPGAGWTGCGNGFAAYPQALARTAQRVLPEVHASALAVARLAAPRLAAGEGVDAALAVPVYLRDKVALTSREREQAAAAEKR